VVGSLRIVAGENMHDNKTSIVVKKKKKPEILIIGEPKYLYRYTYIRHEYNQVSICNHEYLILKETECGYWIMFDIMFGIPRMLDYNSVNKRWVPKDGIRIFARSTKKDALESLKRRCLKHLKIMESEKITVKNVLFKVEDMLLYDKFDG